MIHLKRGDRGKEVREAQHLINVKANTLIQGEVLKPIAVDGVYGKNTESAVSLFKHLLNINDAGGYSLYTHLALMGRKYPVFSEKLNEFYNENIPYIWGGKILTDGKSNNNYGGLDCSGLASAIYNNVFNSVMANAMHMYEKTERVKQPMPGDLVFYGRSNVRITHVCLVVDNEGGIIGMIGGGSRTKAPVSRACIKYLPSFAYRNDVRGFGQIV